MNADVSIEVRGPQSTPTVSADLVTVIERQPPRPIAGDWAWQVLGARRGLDVELFYHPAGERRSTKQRRIDQAKAICQTCPVITECATWSLKTHEPYGVWGGLSEDDRAGILGVTNLRYPAPSSRPTRHVGATD